MEVLTDRGPMLAEHAKPGPATAALRDRSRQRYGSAITARDLVVAALVADGWTITDDPLALSYGGRDLYVDLGATQGTVGAERRGERIAVEIKSFLSPSVLADLELAVGQHAIYRAVLASVDPLRTLHLAVPRRIFEGVLSERLGQLVLHTQQLSLVVFDEHEGKPLQWIP